MRRQGGHDWRGSLDGLGRAIVERLGGRWTPGGGMCRCPVHDDRTPSLSVRPGNCRLLFHCFAGCDTGRVIRELRDLGLIEANVPCPRERRNARVRRRDQGNRAVAMRLWAEARPLGGSPAEAYLAERGLTLAPTDLRYHPRTPCGRRTEAIFRPALLAAVRDETGLVAVHRTFLDIRSSSIAAMTVPKRALGALGAGAVRLFPPAGDVLGWAEGIESALAATILTGIGCWATLGNEQFRARDASRRRAAARAVSRRGLGRSPGRAACAPRLARHWGGGRGAPRGTSWHRLERHARLCAAAHVLKS